ncbi:MAG: divalent metal cation transporter [Deltaproteobacteria bacterium]|jgi:Mn2+/Fe2+ NRAMP family transporter|nr:divalent metal cation transporter [Deltaproteobacteria bacterium]
MAGGDNLSAQKKNSGSGTMSVLIGAAFLMATSAIGPGFLTQTTVFTQKLAAAFAFAVLISVLIDIVIQLNIWRILGVTGLRAQDVANKVFPGLGHFLAFAVCLGGLFFNIGNVGGCALGAEVIFGVPHVAGALVSAALAILLFLNKEMGRAMDKFAQILGFVMITLVLVVVVKTAPPVGLALKETFAPSQIDWFTILTLVGGTVGGYITFAGAHRIIDAGIVGTQNLRQISIGSINGIVITGVMRYLLFLAILGVVVTGATLDPKNPAADAFRLGAGEIGYRVFGVVLWAAAITSVVGASYTSVSFLRTLFAVVDKYHRYWIIAFILTSTCIFITVGRPVTILVVVGTLNALILPLSLVSILLASHRKSIVGEYKHPLWMSVPGYIMVAFTAWMGVQAFGGILAFLK